MGGQEDMSVEEGDVAYQLAEYGSNESVYPFGLDPMWHVTTNELLFFNSFKMKLSVIFGIIQMFFGTCLKGVNAVYFGEKLDLYLEVLPMMVFAASLFIYMVVLIFMKWSIDWNERMLSATCFDPAGNEWQGDWTVCDQSGNGYCTPWGYSCTDYDTTADKCPLDYGGTGDGCQPPNLITSLINIALNPGSVEEPLYQGQNFIQNILLVCAFASVPVLLLAKPYFISKAMHGQPKVAASSASSDEEKALLEDELVELKKLDELEEEGEGDNLGEVIIHQAIETIEFVLGLEFGPFGISRCLLGKMYAARSQNQFFCDLPLVWVVCRCHHGCLIDDGCPRMFFACLAIALGRISK